MKNQKFGQVLVLHRESAPPRCPQFAALEEAYYRFMDINLKLTMNLLDFLLDGESLDK